MTRWSSEVVNRRTFVRSVVAATSGLAAASLLGCSDDDEDQVSPGTDVETAPGTPEQGGEFRFSNTFTEKDLDPHTSLHAGFPYWAAIGELLFEVNNKTGDLDSRLAESSETSPDGLTVTFKVRPGAKWHNAPPTNGAAVTAEDVAFSIERITGRFDQQNIARYQRRSLVDGLDRAEAVDSRTVRLVMKRPNAGLLRGLADFRNVMIPKAVVDSFGGFGQPTSLVGSGQFVSERFEPGRSAQLRRHEGFWEQPKPYLESMTWTAIVDPASQVSALLSNQLHMLTGLTKTMEDTIKGSRSDIRIVPRVHPFWPNLRFNMAKEPWTDSRAREGIFLLIDGPAMMDGFYGPGRWEFAGPLPVVAPGAIPSEELANRPGFRSPTKEDINKGQKLIAEAGFAEGAGLSIDLVYRAGSGTVGDEIAIRFEDQIKRALPKASVKLDAADAPTHTTKQAKGEFSLIQYQILSAPDPFQDLAAGYKTGGARNYGRFSDSTIDRLLEKLPVTLDAEERSRALREVQEKIIAANYVKVLGNYFAVDALLPEVRGYEVGEFDAYGGITAMLQTRNIWLAK